jgi:ABC-type polysaccharide/polyol phosphate transport system ATPase subunit
MQTASTVDDENRVPAAGSTPPGSAPIVIEARGVTKTFRVPEHRVDTLKERATHPFTRMEYRELDALRDVSFDIRRGEFFGIVGQNGSGKSTLLKILASIYRADRGTVRMAGKLAPFIELGVGFNPELTGRENCVINGVLMGLSKREARERIEAVLEFAELEDFAELKLKNYSSGMMVRLAFAVMVQADADIMLIDEVLAVGDAAFAQKCMDVFHEKRAAGRTIVLVTHDMSTVQSLCHRALVLDKGSLAYVGDPETAAIRYYRLSFGANRQGAGATEVPDFNAHVVDASIENERGERVESLAQGEALFLNVLLEARRELADPSFTVHITTAQGVVVFDVWTGLAGSEPRRVGVGERVRVSGRIGNNLVPGSYTIGGWVRRASGQAELAVQGLRLLDFEVHGPPAGKGVVTVDADVTAVRVTEA